jgi:DNA/RNA endonuclease YhcR with UshA esterase domain
MLRMMAMLWAVLFCTMTLHAEDTPATQPSTNPAVIQASDLATLKSKVGEIVAVEGVVERASWSASKKVMNIYFKDARDGFMCAVFEKNKEKVDAGFEGDAAAKLGGAKIRVTGKIGMFRERPQILIDKPEQVTILEAAVEKK